MNSQQTRRERMLSVRETAQVLGLCLDSVRRHLRSGKMPGVRVGRNWRIPESQLSAYMGLVDDEPVLHTNDHLDSVGNGRRAAFHESAYGYGKSVNNKTAKSALATRAAARETDLLNSQNEVIEALFRTHPARSRILGLVKEAASGAHFTSDEAQNLLSELNELLHQL